MLRNRRNCPQLDRCKPRFELAPVIDDRGDRVAKGRWLPTALWLVSLTLATPIATNAAAAPPGASFSCVKPSEIEALVCRDPELAAADRRMAAFYAVARAGALGRGSSQLGTQRDWLKERDRVCARGARKVAHTSLRACLIGEYDDRLEQLAIADLMASPKESLAELGRIRPNSLPLYRAAHDYAAIDDRKRRTAVVAADLASLFATMDENTRKQFSPSSPYHLATSQVAAASDENFAAFFSMDSVLEVEGDVTWPCAVLVRRPGLLQGLGAYFGGAIDGRIPDSDCEDALPPMGAVDALVDEANRIQPFDSGTIRFSIGRDYARLKTAVRLHRTEEWETKAGKAKNALVAMTREERAWRRAHKAEFARAQAELTAYYIKYFDVAPEAARRDAVNAIDALVGDPFEADD